MCNRIYIFNFKKQTSKKNKKNKARIQKKAKETNEEKIIFPENRLKKNEFAVEDFSRHPHFRKQEFFLSALL